MDKGTQGSCLYHYTWLYALSYATKRKKNICRSIKMTKMFSSIWCPTRRNVRPVTQLPPTLTGNTPTIHVADKERMRLVKFNKNLSPLTSWRYNTIIVLVISVWPVPEAAIAMAVGLAAWEKSSAVIIQGMEPGPTAKNTT